MIVTIHVTDEDIRKGERELCEFCPVALALKRVVKHGIEVEVDENCVGFAYTWREAMPAYSKFPDAVSNFIHAFDLTGKGNPFHFDLSIRDDLLNVGAKSQARKAVHS